MPVVTVISLTSLKPGRKVYPVEALLKASETGLPRDSIAMAHQLWSISKERLEERYGSLEKEEIKNRIRSAVKTYLDL